MAGIQFIHTCKCVVIATCDICMQIDGTGLIKQNLF